ncbi:hypothetical protein Tco_1310362 [Tanacetum coccineum]
MVTKPSITAIELKISRGNFSFPIESAHSREDSLIVIDDQPLEILEGGMIRIHSAFVHDKAEMFLMSCPKTAPKANIRLLRHNQMVHSSLGQSGLEPRLDSF